VSDEVRASFVCCSVGGTSVVVAADRVDRIEAATELDSEGDHASLFQLLGESPHCDPSDRRVLRIHRDAGYLDLEVGDRVRFVRLETGAFRPRPRLLAGLGEHGLDQVVPFEGGYAWLLNPDRLVRSEAGES
jgi:hypothetical protein